MGKNLKRGAGSVGGIIAIIIVILVLLFGAYYFWQSKIEPRFHRGSTSSTPTTSSTTNGVEINVSATTS